MACSRGKASPDSHTKLRLFADSGGFCQNPDCNENLFLSIGDTDFHIAEMAHVFAASDNGPRLNNKLSKEERGDYENLILLCPTCHTKIDKAENEYPNTLILKWKTNHVNRIKDLFNIKIFNNRKEVRSFLNRFLDENKKIFEIYGPLTDERFNPESNMPNLWIKKIHSTILPNNRLILNTVDLNYALLNDNERDVIETFRQHVSDFENKHINNAEENGIQFPSEMENIFK
ncbi:MAG: hypothetical protein PWQ17_2563 [Anaerophaga sp.]|nr:hypothetical protein [Anaerophaga sp.]